MRAAGLFVLAAATVWFTASCGGESGEARLEEASAELEEARAQVEDAKEEVAARRADLDQAQEALAQAQGRLRQAEQSLAATENRVDAQATDLVLFRKIQKKLLEDDDLEEVAISAKVNAGNVVLSGAVPNADLRDRALELARETPGVSTVQSRIEVQVSAQKGQ